MKAKKFLTMAALTMGLAVTGAMMSSCSNPDYPTVDPNEGVLPDGQTIVLSELEGDYVAQDGDILTGTLDGNTQPYKISIAEGATVSLSDATIQRDYSKNYSWAGITCLGDATIILDGENSVEGFHMYYPGIQPGPGGTTLTIKGESKIGTEGDITKGNVFGGGESSWVTGADHKVTVTLAGKTQVLGNVYGGGDSGVVEGSTEVNIQQTAPSSNNNSSSNP